MGAALVNSRNLVAMPSTSMSPVKVPGVTVPSEAVVLAVCEEM